MEGKTGIIKRRTAGKIKQISEHLPVSLKNNIYCMIKRKEVTPDEKVLSQLLY